MMTDVVYLTKIGCHDCHEPTTFAHRGDHVPVDQATPVPDVSHCGNCGSEYPDDLEPYTWDVHEAQIVDPFEVEGACRV